MLEVKKKCCNQCLFSKNKIVSDERKKEIITGCLQEDSHFVCHKATIENKEVVCRGFYEKHTSQMIRISQRLGAVKFVD